MKTIPKTALLLFFAVTLFACKKEGPAGPQGVPGPQGPQGPAEVLSYTFGARTFTGSENYILKGLTQAKVDSSLILAYYNPANELASAWYPVPGLGSGSAYATRYLVYGGQQLNEYIFSLRVMKAEDQKTPYALPLTFTKLKIFIVPPGKIIPGGKMAKPDLDDYYAVKEYYGIED